MPDTSTPTAPYDPGYDPLLDPTPGRGRDYAPTYWIDTAGAPPEDDGPVTADTDADIVLIGSGFTGLCAALFLAREHGIKATVLEANRVAWGCSTRNGGQAQLASGRLKRSQWIQRWGRDTALRLHGELCEAMDTFKGLIAEIDCDPQPGGHLYIAHKPKVMPALERESDVCNQVFGYRTHILNAAAVRAEWVHDREAAGALYEPEGIGVHAGKLAFGYQRLARALGVKVHTASPVEGWSTRNGVHHLRTPGGVVKARAVGVATGGYTAQSLHPRLKNRLMPVLSNSLVTRVLTEDELTACGFKTRAPLTDTRILRHYYRLLPDNRVQIGSRSAVTGRDAPQKRYERLLVAGLERKFPALRGIDIDYSWWGWVDVSHDMMPRISEIEAGSRAYCALGYGGNGVMYSAQAGRRLAERLAGKSASPDLPILDRPLPYPHVLRPEFASEALAPFRRLGQRMLYRWYHVKDEVL